MQQVIEKQGFWQRFSGMFANPLRFIRLADKIILPTALISLAFFAVALPVALYFSPPDYQQSETVRIMYVHVPAAILASFIYASMGLAALSSLVWRHILAGLYIRAAAPVGLVLAVICLASGAIWGKPMWGAWWVWDARLTSMLILAFLYLGIIGLVDAFDDPERGEKASYILILIGLIDLPIIKFSVNWWNSLHQTSSLMKMGGPSMDKGMFLALMLMFAAISSLVFCLIFKRMKTEILRRKLYHKRMKLARR